MRKITLSLLGILLSYGLLLAPMAKAEKHQVGVFDFYVLTLSWSPTFCLTHSNNEQCSKGYGFVLHGLWPQYADGGWPENCPPITPLSATERSYGNTLFPSDSLLTHEWQKHGTCSGLGAKGYLDEADKAVTAVNIPPQFQAPAKTLLMSSQHITAAFTASNPHLPADGIVTICSGNALAEVRICQDKDLNFMSCPPTVKSQCKGDSIRVVNIR